MANKNNNLIQPNYSGLFGDFRLGARMTQLCESMSSGLESSLLKISKSDHQAKAYYRLLANDKVTEGELIDESVQRVAQCCKDLDLIIPVDTSEFNLNNGSARLKPNSGFGMLSDNRSMGFHLHPSFVLNAKTHEPIGFSDVQIWAREKQLPRDHQKLPTHEKESNKWLLGVKRSSEVLKDASSVTFVQDREGDIYDQFALFDQLPSNNYFVIRARGDRCTANKTTVLQTLRKTKVAARSKIFISDNKGKAIAHTMDIKFIGIEIIKPRRNRGSVVKSVKVSVVEVVSKTDSKITWRIYTNKPVKCPKEAMNIINIYKSRWQIEQLFRLLKSEGYDLENSELRTGFGIRKLTLLCMNTALLIKRLRLAWHSPNKDELLSDYFSKEEIIFLFKVEKIYQGSTAKLQNPFPEKSLDRAAWIIARIGGWKGFVSRGKPGIITIQRGFEIFHQMLDGYRIAKLVGER